MILRCKNIFIIFTLAAFLGLPFFVFRSIAATDFDYLKIYDGSSLSLKNQFALYENIYGYNLSLIDLGGDGLDEIVLSSQKGDPPTVKILRANGSLINEFFVFDQNFSGGINMAGCDFDGDNKSEILVGAGAGGGPHVRIFDGFGQPKINAGFFADSQDLRSGVRVGCADINGDNLDEILTVTGDTEKFLKIFDRDGLQLNLIKLNFKSDNISLSKIDLGGDGVDEILVAGGTGDEPLVQIYRGDLSLINEFLVFNQNFTGGVNVTAADLDNDNRQEIITTPGLGGGPHLRVFNGFGQEKITNRTFVFDNDFKGGLSLAVGNLDKNNDPEIVLAPQGLPTGRTDLYKYIDIDVSEQTFSYYQNGFLINKFLTSTGKPSTPTRLGEFTAFSKYDMAYGAADGQTWGMPYFIGFYMSGGLENGIHELPFLNGYREGEASLGHAVSHGCVRLAVGAAQEVYDWIEINRTQVIVHK